MLPPPELGLNKLQERLSGASRMQENLLAAGAVPRNTALPQTHGRPHIGANGVS